MKFSFTTMATPGMNVREEAGLARKFGYKGIDLRVSDHLGEIKLASSSSELKEVRDILNSEGISLAGLFCYNSCADTDKNSWSGMKESILRHLELAAVMGSPSIRIFAGDPLKQSDQEGYIKRTAEVIGEVLDTDGTEISIVLQNHLNGFSASQGIAMAEMLGNGRFGLAFSPDHCLLMGEEPEKIGGMLKKHAKQMYLADLLINEEGHRCILPGKGTVPLQDAFRIVGGSSFEGWITFKWEKIWHPELENAEVALPYFMEYMTAKFS